MRFNASFRVVVPLSVLVVLAVEFDQAAAQNSNRSRGATGARASASSSSSSSSSNSSSSHSAQFGGGNPLRLLGPNFPQQLGRSGTSTSRKVSVSENGKNISVSENDEGVAVSVDGRVVKAKNPAELKKKNPQAFELYEKYLGPGSGRAIAIAGGSARSGGGSSAGGSSSGGRQVITEENGRRISIIEDEDGITVSSGGRVIRAANAAELKKKNIKAYELYEKHLGAAAMEDAGGFAAGRDAAGGGAAGGNAAVELMRQQLQKQILENADNPQIRVLLERMLLELDEK